MNTPSVMVFVLQTEASSTRCRRAELHGKQRGLKEESGLFRNEPLVCYLTWGKRFFKSVQGIAFMLTMMDACV